MTREEKAIMYFKDMRKKFCEDYLLGIPKDSVAYKATMAEKEFYDTAIEALEQEPYDDAKYHEEHGEVIVDKAVWEDAKRALEQEPCDDAVSRQAVLDYIHRILNQGTGKKKSFEFIQKYVEKLPSVNPQEPKTGHCEDCKHFQKLPYHADTLGKCIHHTGFCPKGDWYCADYEPQESEDKE